MTLPVYIAKADLLDAGVREQTLLAWTNPDLTIAEGEEAAAVDDDKIARACAAASRTVDTLTGSRYSVQNLSADGIEHLKHLAVKIAVFELAAGVGDAPPDSQIRLNYNDAVKQLRDLSDGRLALAAPAATIDSTFEVSGEQRLTHDELEGM